MKKTLSIGLVVAVVAMLAAGAYAQGWGRGGGWGMMGGAYGAPPAAQEEYAKFMQDTLQERQQIAAKSIELRALYAQPNPDQAKIDGLRDEIYTLQKSLAAKADKAGIRAGGYGPRGGYGPGAVCPGGGPYGAGYGPHGGRGRGAGWGRGTCGRF